MFLDADVFFTGNLDLSFDWPECTRVAGAASPFNSGFFRVDPKISTFVEILTILRTKGFDQKGGWNMQCQDGKVNLSNSGIVWPLFVSISDWTA
jgi:hypothetical protein